MHQLCPLSCLRLSALETHPALHTAYLRTRVAVIWSILCSILPPCRGGSLCCLRMVRPSHYRNCSPVGSKSQTWSLYTASYPQGRLAPTWQSRPSLDSLEVTTKAAISTGRLRLPAASRCAYSQPYSSLMVWASWEPHGVADPFKAERTCFFSLSAFHLTLTPVTPALSDPSPEMPLEMVLIITQP